MLNSIVAKVSSAPNAEVVVYEVPATKVLANVSVIIANMDSVAAPVKLGVTNAGTLSDVDLLEDGVTLSPRNGALRRTNVIMAPGEKMIVQSTSGNLAVRVYGLEQQ
jgi:hypothetical protein